MPLAPGTRFGPYEILGPLGAGGMGEVYRARDTRLGREVAIKVLPEAFAQDADRQSRFEREAKAIAALSHPNILAIHDFGGAYVVTELLEGASLRDRVKEPLPIRKSVDIAVQVARGLAAAHGKGIVHRDLKPENIFLLADGQVKILDFGLARQTATNSGATETVSAITDPGVVMGTAGYMSPEQVRGQVVDTRTDLFALGAVLYEMLSGERAFRRETTADTMSAVLTSDPPDLLQKRVEVSPGLARIVRHCLEKNPAERFQSARDVVFALESLANSSEATDRSAQAVTRNMSVRRAGSVRLLLYGATLGVVATAAVAYAVWAPRRPATETPQPVTRLSMLFTGAGGVPSFGHVAIAPDGRAVAVVMLETASGTSRLWLRELGAPRAHPIETTDDAAFPFWSPDSRQIGFFAKGKLKRVSRAGGASQIICDAVDGRGGAWNQFGTIVFAPNRFGPLLQVDANGGTPGPASVLDAERHENDHRFPVFLPDGRHFMYSSIPGVGNSLFSIRVASLDDPRGHALTAASMTPCVLPPDRLVFTRGDALVTQRLDLSTLQAVGESLPTEDRPETLSEVVGSPMVSCARDGTLAFIEFDSRPTEAVWFSADGKRLNTVLRHPAPIGVGNLSRAGDRLATNDRNGGRWVFDLKSGTGLKISSSDQAFDSCMVWTAGDRAIASRIAEANRQGVALFDPSNGSQRVISNEFLCPTSASPDGHTLVLSRETPDTRNDLMFMSLDGGDTLRAYLATAANEQQGTLSHDGRRIAYVSDVSGTPELYVDTFPTPTGTKRVSGVTLGGSTGSQLPLWWRRDDQALLFIGADGSLFEVDARPSTTSMREPRKLFTLPLVTFGVWPSPVDDRFLVLLPVGERTPAVMIVQRSAVTFSK